MTPDRNRPDNSGVPFPPPFAFVAVFLVGLLVQRFYPFSWLPPAFRLPLASFFLAASLVLLAWSFALFRRAGTSVLPDKPTTAIVTGGPYGWTRNPLYVAMLCLYLGVALWFGLFWVVIGAPISVLIVNAYVIPREEAYLERKFGDEYLRYKARVRRWI